MFEFTAIALSEPTSESIFPLLTARRLSTDKYTSLNYFIFTAEEEVPCRLLGMQTGNMPPRGIQICPNPLPF